MKLKWGIAQMIDWFLWLIGKKQRTRLIFECSDPECGCRRVIVVYHNHGEDAWAALQKQVQAAFEKQNKMSP